MSSKTTVIHPGRSRSDFRDLGTFRTHRHRPISRHLPQNARKHRNANRRELRTRLQRPRPLSVLGMRCHSDYVGFALWFAASGGSPPSDCLAQSRGHLPVGRARIEAVQKNGNRCWGRRQIRNKQSLERAGGWLRSVYRQIFDTRCHLSTGRPNPGPIRAFYEGKRQRSSCKALFPNAYRWVAQSQDASE